MYQNSL